MIPLKRLSLAVAALVIACAPLAHAQIPAPPDVSKMRVKLGPVYFDPTLALTNAGIDTNVFNEADDASPKKDFTVTITPQTALWMRAGRTWLNGLIKEDIVWFKKYSSERSANSALAANWIVPLTRVTFAVGADHLSTRERPGFEIDTRSRRTENGVNGAAELHTFSKTFIGVRAERRTVAFDGDEEFLDVNLRNELNRTVTTEALTVRNQLTPLTDLIVDAGREQDRFEFDHLRDSDSTRVMGGLKFDQLALIKGGLQFGYRDFTPLAAGVPGFKGLTSAVDLTYVLLGSTRFAFGTTRDVQYSFDIDQPYYVQTAFTASVAQQIFGPIDAQARVGAARLAYRTRANAVVVDADRIDHTHSYGGGIGYHLSSDMRLAFNLDHVARESAVNGRAYHGLRYGTSIAYGF